MNRPGRHLLSALEQFAYWARSFSPFLGQLIANLDPVDLRLASLVAVCYNIDGLCLFLPYSSLLSVRSCAVFHSLVLYIFELALIYSMSSSTCVYARQVVVSAAP